MCDFRSHLDDMYMSMGIDTVLNIDGAIVIFWDEDCLFTCLQCEKTFWQCFDDEKMGWIFPEGKVNRWDCLHLDKAWEVIKDKYDWHYLD